MFAKGIRSVFVTPSNWRIRVLFAAALVFLVSIPTQILHATPIMNGEDFQPLSKQLVGNISYAVAAKSPLEFAVFRTSTSPLPVSSGCIFANNCSNPVEVPEPEALVLVGTGLLLMAGIIRRRLARL